MREGSELDDIGHSCLGFLANESSIVTTEIWAHCFQKSEPSLPSEIGPAVPVYKQNLRHGPSLTLTLCAFTRDVERNRKPLRGCLDFLYGKWKRCVSHSLLTHLKTYRPQQRRTASGKPEHPETRRVLRALDSNTDQHKRRYLREATPVKMAKRQTKRQDGVGISE